MAKSAKRYAIIETNNGLTVVELSTGVTPEQAAIKVGGVVIDEGPYTSFEEAYDALMTLPVIDREDEPPA